jgi:hypothetical protein
LDSNADLAGLDVELYDENAVFVVIDGYVRAADHTISAPRDHQGLAYFNKVAMDAAINGFDPADTATYNSEFDCHWGLSELLTLTEFNNAVTDCLGGSSEIPLVAENLNGTQLEFVPNDGNDSVDLHTFTFNSDGTGSIASSGNANGDISMVWSIDADRVIIEHNDETGAAITNTIAIINSDIDLKLNVIMQFAQSDANAESKGSLTVGGTRQSAIQ